MNKQTDALEILLTYAHDYRHRKEDREIATMIASVIKDLIGQVKKKEETIALCRKCLNALMETEDTE